MRNLMSAYFALTDEDRVAVDAVWTMGHEICVGLEQKIADGLRPTEGSARFLQSVMTLFRTLPAFGFDVLAAVPSLRDPPPASLSIGEEN